MKPWAEENGLTPAGARLAEKALPLATRLIRTLGKDWILIVRVLGEAFFRVHELANRSPEFQREYRRKNHV